MATPSGITAADFNRALNEFAAVVGNEWVYGGNRQQDLLDTYRDIYNPFRDQGDEPVPSGAVAPANVEQVRAVVRIANKYRIPLWAFSTGRNYGYGGPTGVVPGNVTLDLKRMKGIEVNVDHAYAIVEPGVNFFDLYRYIQDRNIKLWLDVPGPGWGSVIGNTLEHGMGFTPYCDRMGVQCGMEVVLPDGDVLRSGMGAMTNSTTWQGYKHGLGPNVDGLFYQSAYGVVTKMGLWLMPEPEAYMACKVIVPRWDDLVPLVNRMRPMRLNGIVANNLTFAPEGGMGNAANAGNLGANGFPQRGWEAQLAFYGLEQVVDLHWQHVQRACADLPGVRFTAAKYSQPINTEEISAADKPQAGVPMLTPGHQTVFMSPVLPFTGETIMECIRVFDQTAQKHGRRFFGGNFHVDAPRAVIGIVGAQLRVGDDAFNRQAVALAKDWIKEGAARGWGAYRVHTSVMDDTRAAYDFNDRALLRFHEKLKDAIDPNGIMQPGKNGLWPRQMRSGRA